MISRKPETVASTHSLYRDVSKFGHDQITALYELVEAAAPTARSGTARLFLGVGAIGFYIVKMGLDGAAVEISRKGTSAELVAQLQLRHERAAKKTQAAAAVLGECGGTLIVAALGVLTGPLAGLLIASAMIGTAKCLIALDRARHAWQGTKSLFDSSDGKVVELVIDVADLGVAVGTAAKGVTKTLAVRALAGRGAALGHRAALGQIAANEIAKLVIVHVPGLVLKGENLVQTAPIPLSRIGKHLEAMAAHYSPSPPIVLEPGFWRIQDLLFERLKDLVSPGTGPLGMPTGDGRPPPDRCGTRGGPFTAGSSSGGLGG